MTDFQTSMRITIADMARTIYAQVEIEKARHPELIVDLMAIAAAADDIEKSAVTAPSLTSTQLVSLLGELKDIVQDLTLLTA